MDFDKIIESSCRLPKFHQLTFRDILFSEFSHRNEDCCVLISHIGEQVVKLTLNELRIITLCLAERFEEKGICKGDTIMLASFSCSNEFANVLIFTAAASRGVRIFIPIFPEASEFNNWKDITGFSHVIIPYREILGLHGHAREKEIVAGIRSKM